MRVKDGCFVRYGSNVGEFSRMFVKAMREGRAAAERGIKIKTWWGDDGKDAVALRYWFWDKLDGMINLKAGLRSDGAPKRDRSRCRCKGCIHQYGHDLQGGLLMIEARAMGYCRNCPIAHREWGGRKWSDDYQRDLVRDRYAIQRQVDFFQVREHE